MNLPLRIRHKFNRSGAFDLRRRVLMKNFLLGNKYKLDPPDEEPIVEEIENEPDCEEAIDRVSDELNFTRTTELSETEVHDELRVSDSNASVMETDLSEHPQMFESLECETGNKDLNHPTNVKKTRKRRKMKFSFKKKQGKKICTNEDLQDIKDPIIYRDSASFDKQNHYADQSAIDGSVNAISDVNTSSKPKKSKFHLKLKRRLPEKSCPSVKKTRISAKNKSSPSSKNEKKSCDKSFSFKIHLRKKQETTETPMCSEDNEPKSIFRLFRSKTFVETTGQEIVHVKKDSLSFKRKRESDLQSIERIPSKNRSVSVQTDVTIPAQMHESGCSYPSYSRNNKKPRFDEDIDKNKYWLRSTNMSEVRVLKPLNSEAKMERPKSAQADFFSTVHAGNYKFDANKITRSKSIQENKFIRNPATICRRVKSVRLPLHDEGVFSERSSNRNARNSDYRNRLRRRSSEENFHYNCTAPSGMKFLQVSASPCNVVPDTSSSSDYGFPVTFK